MDEPTRPTNSPPTRVTRRRALAALGAGCVGVGGASFIDLGNAQTAAPLRTTPIAKGLDHPWSVAFLPSDAAGRMLVTERRGQMRVVARDGSLSPPLRGLPPVVAEGQGGLLDVAVHPGFARNRWVLWSYAEPAPSGTGNSTAVARGRLADDLSGFSDVTVLFSQRPKIDSSAHFGSRLVFARDGTLFVTLGERFVRRDDAQTLTTHHGKVVRIGDDGKAPADNPFVGRAGALPEIWSYGHRNVQGAALHPVTGDLWTHEDGPQGGDELNLDLPGRNYGWPVITAGREYGSGAQIGEGTTRADIEPALVTWVPSIAPSGMAFVTGERHPAWRGQLLVGALKAQCLVRLELDGNTVRREHRHPVGARVRDVRQGPDGQLVLLTDERDGQLLRIEPQA